MSERTFFCRECGWESPKWLGRCPGCQSWNSLVEKDTSKSTPAWVMESHPQEMKDITSEAMPRLITPFAEFNRVLGGGIVPGSLILVGGDPGVGKSTLLLQVAAALADGQGKVLYVSGEESGHQIKLRAERLGLPGAGLYLLTETRLEAIQGHIDALVPAVVIVDSIQTVYLEQGGGPPGSPGQLRECTLRLMQWAKSRHLPIFLVGHVTKEGIIAGPKMVEHIVDVVLYLEGENFSSYRLLRGVKNRYGSTNEVGIFEIGDGGLVEVENPSQVLLAHRGEKTTGSAVVPTLEGTRPLLVELQALATPTPFGLPRRTVNGLDLSRLLLMIAVLTKRVGLPLSNQDIIASVVGGLKIGEPAADLGLALAIASSLRDVPLNPHLVVMGEVGLGGELRGVSQTARRLTEAAKLGFQTCLIPSHLRDQVPSPPPLKIITADSVATAIKQALPRS
ncbi:MAG: DNA repair protein RadA [Chloroflexi bacterium]|nr:DNA repair protein RadA [Chloroflexota bacterium]